MADPIRVGVHGWGTIGRRVADGVAQLEKDGADVALVGVTKQRPDRIAQIGAARRGMKFYTDTDHAKFEARGIKPMGGVKDLLKKADVIFDCTPSDEGAKNKPLYQEIGVKAIYQGGEEEEVAPSYNDYANPYDGVGADSLRVVSCNTTALARVAKVLDAKYHIDWLDAVLIRRAVDPAEVKKGPVNSIEFDKEAASHHAADVQTVMPRLRINTRAIVVPVTEMHGHVLSLGMEEPPQSVDEVVGLLGSYPRILTISASDDGVSGTAQAYELGRELGRDRGDLYENVIWTGKAMRLAEGVLEFNMSVPQQSIVIPDNLCALLNMFELGTVEENTQRVDRVLGIGDLLKPALREAEEAQPPSA